jgi:hypothetical protein
MLPLLQEGRRIINLDESWLNDTNYMRKLWIPTNKSTSIPLNPVQHRLALIAALDTEGRVYYSLTQANTDQNIMLAFLIGLMHQLDLENPEWREDTIFLLDGAKYHVGSDIRTYMRKLELEVMWSAPYSYSTAPIEMVYAVLKFGELNPEGIPTGKKVSIPLFILIL